MIIMTSIKPHLFVVDDDLSVRVALKRLLASSGYEVETFSSGQSFLDSVPTDTEGILILDLRMPGLDGFQVQDKLKELHSPMKIIFITAHAQAGDRERALRQGAVGFLMKPFNEDSLFDYINKAKSEGVDK